MTALRNKRKLAGVNRDSQEEHPRNNLPQDTNIPRVKEDYITQVSKEIELKVTHNDSRVLQGRESNSIQSVQTARNSSELTSLGEMKNHSGDFPEL